MKLQSLILSTDEKILRVLRRVLSDLDIDVTHVTEAEAAIRKLTRVRFEAVIVDCHREETAAHVLRSARAALCNKRAVAVAILDGTQAVRSAFDLGAHFTLYKPISMEKAKASFRAARALMKCERRGNIRIPVEIAITLAFTGGETLKTTSVDFSAGGMAIQLARKTTPPGPIKAKFTLPGTEHEVECKAEIAWQNAGKQAGVRFAEVSTETQQQIKEWLARHSPEFEEDDPPVACKLTDLSLGGCYMELSVPFPLRSRVMLSMSAASSKLQVPGVVRVAHTDVGMGVEFARNTDEQRQKVETFLQTLMQSGTGVPELLVEPEGLEPMEASAFSEIILEDPLLELFRTKATVPVEAFQEELRKQRGGQEQAHSVSA
ncbi:MAG TPA: PilZ domain-containing protein [Terriglobales bacterium]|nr:PilZ domain-containing protein [Terriglobales bacterium]